MQPYVAGRSHIAHNFFLFFFIYRHCQSRMRLFHYLRPIGDVNNARCIIYHPITVRLKNSGTLEWEIARLLYFLSQTRIDLRDRIWEIFLLDNLFLDENQRVNGHVVLKKICNFFPRYLAFKIDHTLLTYYCYEYFIENSLAKEFISRYWNPVPYGVALSSWYARTAEVASRTLSPRNISTSVDEFELYREIYQSACLIEQSGTHVSNEGNSWLNVSCTSATRIIQR